MRFSFFADFAAREPEGREEKSVTSKKWRNRFFDTLKRRLRRLFKTKDCFLDIVRIQTYTEVPRVLPGVSTDLTALYIKYAPILPVSENSLHSSSAVRFVVSI